MARPNKARSIGGEDNLAERIAYERESLGLSYEALAKKMTEAGCAIQGSAIYKIEKGNPRRRVTVDELIALADVFEVEIQELLTPMAVLKQAWAEQRLKDLDEAETRLYAAISHLGDVWMDVYRHGLIDVIDGVDDEESVLTYLANKRASSSAAEVQAPILVQVFGKVAELIQRSAAKMTADEANEFYDEAVVEVKEFEEGSHNGQH